MLEAVPDPFPPPVFTGDPVLWHLAEAAAWLARHTEFRLPPEKVAVSRAAFRLNLEIQQRRAKQLVAA